MQQIIPITTKINIINTVGNNLNVLFVLDNTISMQALDYDGKNTRMSGVVED